VEIGKWKSGKVESNQGIVAFDVRIAQRLEAIHAFVGLFEDCSELRFEFRPRAASPRGAVVSAYRSRGSP